MKVEVLHNINRPLGIEKVTFNELKRGQILVEILYHIVSYSQLIKERSKRGEDKWLSRLLIQEATRIVRKICFEITKIKPEDKIVGGWIKCKGIDSESVTYNELNKIINSEKIITFKMYFIVSESRVVKLEEKILTDVSVLFGCAILTESGIVINELRHKENTILRGIALSAFMDTKLYKVDKVIAIDLEDLKLELAKKLTLNVRLDYSIEAIALAKFFFLYLEVKLLLEKRYILNQINNILDDLANRLVLRPLIEINPEWS